MPTRTARAVWNGSLEEGRGEVELEAGGAPATCPVSQGLTGVDITLDAALEG